MAERQVVSQHSGFHIQFQMECLLSDSEKWESMFFYTNYQFRLFSNFTFFLNDPVNGDEIEQRESRNIYGMMNQYTQNFNFDNSSLLWKSGFGFRYDDIGGIELNHVFHRYNLLDRKSFASINETNLYACTSGEWLLGKWMLNPALRLDYLIFGIDDKLADEPGQEDYSATAKGYFVNDLALTYTLKKWELGIQIQNLFNVKWNEAQFYTETRLQNETKSIYDMCFTP